MDNRFFEQPILNSPYHYPKFHWELDKHHQPTQKIIEKRRPAEYISPIPRPRKQKDVPVQMDIVALWPVPYFAISPHFVKLLKP